MIDDELLSRYATTGDGQALGELVQRYAPMVYAAARRQTHDPGMAEDVCQSVFVCFSRRAARVRSGAVLGPWLLQTTRFNAANAMKTEMRRRRHERAAAGMRGEISSEVEPSDRLADVERLEQWKRISPVLDEAIAHLPSRDQTVVALRYFRGLSLREVADATGTTEDGARMRLSRAMDRLRGKLAEAAAGVDLAAMLCSHAIGPVPAHLIAQISAAAAASGYTGVGGGALKFLGAKTMTIKVAASLAAAALIGTVGVSWVERMIPSPPGGARPATSLAMAADAPPDDPGAAAAADRARETANRIKCQNNMKQIGLAVALYANENRGQYPPDFAAVVKNTDLPIGDFCCPSSNTQLPNRLTRDQAVKWVNDNSDYIYIGATMKNSSASDLVAAYEKDADHGGDGINMLFADGHVEFDTLQQAQQQIARTKQAQGL